MLLPEPAGNRTRNFLIPRSGALVTGPRPLLVFFRTSRPHWPFLFFFLHSSIGGVAYVTLVNSSATWAATFRLRGYKCMLVIFVFQ